MPVKEIGSRMSRHQSAIHRVAAKSKGLSSLPSLVVKKGSGGPRKLTSHVLGVVVKQIHKYQGAPAANPKRNLPEAGSPSCTDHLPYHMSRFFLLKITLFFNVF